MTIYRVDEGNYGSEYSEETYFSTMEKAINYARSKGYYQKKYGDPCWLTSPFTRKTMLKHGNFLIDVTESWIKSERYLDEECLELDFDYASIVEIKVL